MTTPLQDLLAQRAELDALISAEKATHFSTHVRAAIAAFQGAGIALDEAAAAMLAFHNSATRPQRAKVPPKFRHKATGATWTGRGKQPRWYADAAQSEIENLIGDLAQT